MSSLRLALKQSLQETANASPHPGDKKKKKKKRPSSKRPRAPRDGEDDDEGSGRDDGSSSEEHEFVDHEEEEEDSSDEGGDDDDDDDDQDGPDGGRRRKGGDNHSHGSGEDPSRHKAANKIQSGWKDAAKKKKRKLHPSSVGSGSASVGGNSKGDVSSGAPPSTATGSVGSGSGATPKRSASPKALRKKQNEKQYSNKSKTVPPPERSVIARMRELTTAECRKNIAPGIRVKVRFTMTDGSKRRKKWYGGRVSAVSREGSKIRIKYDDGTQEVTRFPDVDVIVDDTWNGTHEANAEMFLPRDDEESDDEEDEAQVELNELPQKQPIPPTMKRASPSSIAAKHAAAVAAAAARKDEDETDPREHGIKKRKQDAALFHEEGLSGERLSSPEQPADEAAAATASAPLDEQEDAASEEALKPRRKRGRPPKMRPPEVDEELLQQPVASEIGTVAEASTTSPILDEEGMAQPPPKKKKKKHKLSPSGDISTAESVSSETPDAHSKPVLLLSSESRETEEPKIPPVGDELAATSDTAKDVAQDAEASIVSSAVPNTTIRSATPDQIERVEEKALEKERRTAETADKSTVSAQDVEHPHATDGTATKDEEKRPSLTIRLKKREGGDAICKEVADSDAIPAVEDAAASSQPTEKEKPVSVEEPLGEPEKNICVAPTPVGSELEPRKEQLFPVDEPAASKKEESTKAEAAPETKTEDKPKRLHIHIPKPKLAAQLSDQQAAIRSPVESKVKATPPPKDAPADGAEITVEAIVPESTEHIAKLLNKKELAESEDSNEGLSKSPRPKKKRKRLDKVVEPSETKRHKVDDSEPFEKPPLPASSKVESTELPQPQLNDPLPASTATKEENAETILEDADAGGKALTPRDRAGKNAGIQRRAAKQANERIVSKQDQVVPNDTDKKKKKRKGEEKGADDVGSPEDDSQWVQCDGCSKWRIIPSIVVSTLPSKWFCADNIWDPRRASCDVPEQTAKQAAKEKKRRKKLQARLLLAAQAEAAAAVAEGRVPEVRTESNEKPRLAVRTPPPRSPRPSRDDVPSVKPNKRSSQDLVCEGKTPIRSEKKEKFGKKSRSESSDKLASLDDTEEPQPTSKPRGRGRPRRNPPKEAVSSGKGSNAPSTNASSGGQSQTDPNDNLEWVQCERCEKWRKLPAHISADELPDVWFCSLNTWNPSSASCDAPEDKADGLTDVGFHSGSANKLSYRNLIFGNTGRKANRPVSERTRATESLFLAPNDDEDAVPTVKYASSSAFVSRARNQLVPDENESISVLELMNHSNLWKELRNASYVRNDPGGGSGLDKPLDPSIYTFDNLPTDIRQSTKDLIVHALGDKTLHSDEIVTETHRGNAENLPAGLSAARPYCTSNVVVTALCELVREGSVECLQKMGPEWTLKDWNPRYRRAKPRRSAAETQAGTPKPAEAHKASRCMKIAKPWKRARVH